MIYPIVGMFVLIWMNFSRGESEFGNDIWKIMPIFDNCGGFLPVVCTRLSHGKVLIRNQYICGSNEAFQVNPWAYNI